MEQFLKVDVGIFSIFVLLVIFINSAWRREWNSWRYRLYMMMLFANGVLLAIEVVTTLLDGQLFDGAREINTTLMVIYYVLGPVACLLWTLYADYFMIRNRVRLKHLLLGTVIPALVSAVAAIMSPLNGWYFRYDAAGVYQRGPMLPALVALCYSYWIYAMVQIVRNRHKLPWTRYLSLLLFAVLPAAGGVVQSFIYGVMLQWPGMTVSLLVLYLYSQDYKLARDSLTKVYNRRELDHYLQHKISNADRGKRIAGIMLDIDDFKRINDIYGHAEGDHALEIMAETLRVSFRENDFIARYGGDEFIVLLEVNAQQELQRAVDRVIGNMERLNDREVLPYRITASMGYAVHDGTAGLTADKFLKKLDALMYQDKRKNLAAKNPVTEDGR